MARSLQLKVFLAGRVAVETEGVVIDEGRFPGRQGRLLFAYLVAEQGRPVPRDELAEALWGESPPATWDKALTVVVSKLRGLLTDDLGLDGATVLTAAFGCYRIELPEGSWVDVVVAADAVQEAEQAFAADDLEAAHAAATLAASVARPPFLPGEEGTWVEAKRRGLTDVRGVALTILVDVCLASGDAAEAVKWAEQGVELAPFREAGYRRLMESHTAAGNRAEALQVYERCRRLLSEELGAYPSPETEAIYRLLLEARSARAGATAASEVSPVDLALAVNSGRGSTSRVASMASRKTVAVLTLTFAVTAAAVAGILATRSAGRSPATAVTANSVVVHLGQIHRSGIFGGISFALAIAGAVALFSVEWNQAFTIRDFALQAPETLEAVEGAQGLTPFDIGALIGSSAFFLGWLLFAVSVFLANVFSRVGSALVAIGFFAAPILSLAKVSGPVALIGASIVIGGGWLLLGVSSARLGARAARLNSGHRLARAAVYMAENSQDGDRREVSDPRNCPRPGRLHGQAGNGRRDLTGRRTGVVDRSLAGGHGCPYARRLEHVKIGMTRTEIVAAVGDNSVPGAVGGPEPDVCDEFHPARAPDGLYVMIEDGKLSRITVTELSKLKTLDGFGIGDAPDAIKNFYGTRATATPHKYQDTPAEYITVWEGRPAR